MNHDDVSHGAPEAPTSEEVEAWPGAFVRVEGSAGQQCQECGGPLQWRCPACRIAQSQQAAESPLEGYANELRTVLARALADFRSANEMCFDWVDDATRLLNLPPKQDPAQVPLALDRDPRDEALHQYVNRERR